jgi:hypothetical protein
MSTEIRATYGDGRAWAVSELRRLGRGGSGGSEGAVQQAITAPFANSARGERNKMVITVIGSVIKD